MGDSLVVKWGDELFDDGITNAPQCFMRYGRKFVTAAQHNFICVILSYQYGAAAAYPSIKTIASDLGISEKAVKNHLKDLKESGNILIQPRIRRNKVNASNGYNLHPLLRKCLDYSKAEKAKDQKPTDIIDPYEIEGEPQVPPIEIKGEPQVPPIEINDLIKESNKIEGEPQVPPIEIKGEPQVPPEGEPQVPPKKELEEKNLEEEEEEEEEAALISFLISKEFSEVDSMTIANYILKKKLVGYTNEDLLKAIQAAYTDFANGKIDHWQSVTAHKLQRIITAKKAKKDKPGYFSKGFYPKKTVREETVPEWLQKGKEADKAAKEPEQAAGPTTEELAERARMNELIRGLKTSKNNK